MSDQQITFHCSDCGDQTTTKVDETSENRYGEFICPECAAPPKWEDQSFPIWIELEHCEDNWKMLRRVSEYTGVPADDIPAGEMKYCVVYAYFKINEDGSVEGPYDEKRGELL